jgi:hypothetical protein
MSSSVTRGCRLFTVILVPSKGLRTGCHTDKSITMSQRAGVHSHKNTHFRHATRKAQRKPHAEYTTMGTLGPLCPSHSHTMY